MPHGRRVVKGNCGADECQCVKLSGPSLSDYSDYRALDGPRYAARGLLKALRDSRARSRPHQPTSCLYRSQLLRGWTLRKHHARRQVKPHLAVVRRDIARVPYPNCSRELGIQRRRIIACRRHDSGVNRKSSRFLQHARDRVPLSIQYLVPDLRHLRCNPRRLPDRVQEQLSMLV